MLNRDYLLQDYRLFKKRAETALNKNKVEKSLNLIHYCSLIAWFYPILSQFADDELEQLLEKASDKIIDPDKFNRSDPPGDKKVVLYAGQLIDTGALTEQYLHFFTENDYQVLVIVPDRKNIVQAKNTLKFIEDHPHTELYIPDSRKFSSKIAEVYEKIIEFNPGQAFLHFLPNDVIGYCAFSRINHIKKFYIVHNDHTFWIGKGCADFFLEFRKFGCLLSAQRRNIPAEKLLLLPFYPINNKVKFKGLPFTKKAGQVIGLSGANLYKYLMDPELKYFHAIKELMRRNPNFVFCLCGYGEGLDKILQIFDGDEKKRFHFLGQRDDFYSLIEHIDILFESYPMKGGLTLLFALEQCKAVVGMGNSKNASGYTQDFLGISDYREPETIEEFIEEADLLIKDRDYRQQRVQQLSGHKFNKLEFRKGLKAILEGSGQMQDVCLKEPLSLDDDYFLNEYLKIPNSRALLFRTKLFFLKRSVNINERINHAVKFCKDPGYRLGFKDIFRVAVLVVFGR